jgi:di/tricarboxylate transporter
LRQTQPTLRSLNIVTVAALLTPTATAANAMIMRSGEYRFGGYLQLGIPLLAWWFVNSVGLGPVIWRL